MDAQQAPRLKGPASPRDEMHHARHLRRHVCYKRDECGEVVKGREQMVSERFERHRQPWTSEELQKLKLLAGKGMALKAISKAMTRSEESIKDRAKLDGIGIAKLR